MLSRKSRIRTALLGVAFLLAEIAPAFAAPAGEASIVLAASTPRDGGGGNRSPYLVGFEAAAGPLASSRSNALLARLPL